MMKKVKLSSNQQRMATRQLISPDGSHHHIVKTPLPLEYCSGVCEDYARRNFKIAFCDIERSNLDEKGGSTNPSAKDLP